MRAYRRGGRTFAVGAGGRQLRDDLGRAWRLTEEALLPNSETAGEPRGLERLPGHLSLWFAWYGFFPQTEVYGAPR